MTLQDLLAVNVFQFLLVLGRLSIVFAMMPGLSATYVPVRIRLIVAVLVSFVVLPLVKGYLPPQPTTAAALAWLMVSEMLIGAFLGSLIQIVMATLELAGQIIAQTTGITNALTDDPVTQEQSSIVIGLVNLTAVTMIFITGTHHFMIMAMIDSYSAMGPQSQLFAGDMLNIASRMIDQAFYMGLRLSAPFLVFELVFQVTSGILARLSPQLNVFFVVMPGKIMLGLAVLMITLPSIMLAFLHFMDNTLHGLLAPVVGPVVGPVR